jgi:hypothetical protein
MPPRARPKGPITWKELREQLDYDPKTGWLTWKIRKPRIYPGKRAGYLHVKGGRAIEFCGKNFLENRLIWWWMTGKDPGDLYVDHKNRKRNDNRWKNLRLATHGQNYVNSKTFGPMRGISPRPGKKHKNTFRVKISLNREKFYYTVYSLLAAKRLRNKLERELYGEFACTQR